MVVDEVTTVVGGIVEECKDLAENAPRTTEVKLETLGSTYSESCSYGPF